MSSFFESENIEISKSDKMKLFNDFIMSKFTDFGEGFEFMLNVNYWLSINKEYDTKGISNPMILDDYVFKVNGCRSYGLYVKKFEKDDNEETLAKEIKDNTKYEKIYHYAPDGW